MRLTADGEMGFFVVPAPLLSPLGADMLAPSSRDLLKYYTSTLTSLSPCVEFDPRG